MSEEKDIWNGDILLLRTPYTLETSSCVTFIKENGLQPYITNLTIQIPMSFVEPSNKHLNVLEEHYKHLIGLYCNDIFDGDDDIAVAEVMITALANAIGVLRGILKLPPSKVVTEYGDKLQEFIEIKKQEAKIK